MKTLAVDYGTQRIGLAINQGSLAEPLMILPNQDDQASVTQIAQLCQQYQITQLLIGISEQEMAEKTRAFADHLAAVTGLPVEFIDETLSSARMHDLLRQPGIKASKRRGHIDHFVAAALLQEWLDS